MRDPMGRMRGLQGSVSASTGAWGARVAADEGRLGQANSNEVGERDGR